MNISRVTTNGRCRDLIHEPPLQPSVYLLLVRDCPTAFHIRREVKFSFFLGHRLVLLWPKVQRWEALVGSTLL